jgi:hypothetical protein
MISYSGPTPERSGDYQLGLRATEQVSTEFDTEDCHMTSTKEYKIELLATNFIFIDGEFLIYPHL